MKKVRHVLDIITLNHRPFFYFSAHPEEFELLLEVFPRLKIIHKKRYNAQNTKDILQHSLFVINNLHTFEMFSHYYIPRFMFYAALFHDAGKPFVARFDKKKNRYVFYNHEYYSIAILYESLHKYIDITNLERAAKIIKYHMVLGGSPSSSYLSWVEQDLERYGINLQDLYVFYFCDTSYPIHHRKNVKIYPFAPQAIDEFFARIEQYEKIYKGQKE